MGIISWLLGGSSTDDITEREPDGVPSHAETEATDESEAITVDEDDPIPFPWWAGYRRAGGGNWRTYLDDDGGPP